MATSSAGANMPSGLVSALASAPGRPAVLEVDEGYLGAAAAAVHPRVVTLLNLSRDQLDRVSEVRMIAGRWRDVLAPTTATVVANADDPLVVWGASRAAHVLWVSAGQLWHLDAVGCPACDGRIVFESSGDWWCACGFRRPSPDAVLRDAVSGDATFGDAILETPDGRSLSFRLSLPGRCNRANAAMAAMAASALGVDVGSALAAMSGLGEVEGRFATVEVRDTHVRLLLAKNPAGWTELLDLLQGGLDPVVVAINARIADGHDPSWLWDVPFERLAGRFEVATGERCRDLGVRLRYAGVEHVTVPDELDALAAPGMKRVEFVGNYTAFQGRPPAVAHRHRLLQGHCYGHGDRHEDSVDRPLPTAPAAAPHRGASSPVFQVDSTRWSRRRRCRPRCRAVPPAHRRCAWWWCTRTSSARTATEGTGRCWQRGPHGAGSRWSSCTPPPDQPLPEGADLYCLGGGEDGPQVQSAERLRDGTLARAVARGAVVLAVCAGYQILGNSFVGPDGEVHAGVGLLDVDSRKGTGRRAVGELAAEPLGGGLGSNSADDGHGDGAGLETLQTLTGFENHGAVTRLGAGARPFARVLTGVGNGNEAHDEGARAGRVIGTYLHGPALARNPSLADLLLTWATGAPVRPLDDAEEGALRAERLAAPGRGTRPHRPRWRRAAVTLLPIRILRR